MEAVKQGSICLGLKSNQYVVLCSLKKHPSELACFQDKMFKVDDYIGMAISGLTADARVLCKYMRNESLNYKMTYGSNQPLNRLIFKIADSNIFFIQNHK
jgi:20S proteasome subunit alpha 6